MFGSPSVYPSMSSSLFSPTFNPLNSPDSFLGVQQFSLSGGIGSPTELKTPSTAGDNAGLVADCFKLNPAPIQPQQSNPPLISMILKGFLSNNDKLTIPGTDFSCVVQSNGQVVDKSNESLHGLEEWIRSSQQTYNTLHPDDQKVFDWTSIRVNDKKQLSEIRSEYFENTEQLRGNSGASFSYEQSQLQKQPSLSLQLQQQQQQQQLQQQQQQFQQLQRQVQQQQQQLQPKKEQLQQELPQHADSSTITNPGREFQQKFYEQPFVPLADDEWALRNTIIYKDNFIQVVYNRKKDTLCYPFEVLTSFLPPVARDYLSSTNYFCPSHMYNCSEYNFFKHHEFSFKQMITSDGVEHLYQELRRNTMENIRKSAIFLEEPVTLFKAVEEKRNTPVFKPRGNVVRAITLHSLFSGSEQVRQQTEASARDQEALKDSGQRLYRCECGEAFPTSQSKAGHSHFCKVHQEMKKKKNAWKAVGKGKAAEKFPNDNIVYKCDCGKTFPTSQAKAGHCHFCPVHQELKSSGKPTISNKQATSSELLLSFGDFAANSSTISTILQRPLKTAQERKPLAADASSLSSVAPSPSAAGIGTVVPPGGKRPRDGPSVFSPVISSGDLCNLPFSESCVLSPRTMALYTAALEQYNNSGIEEVPPLNL